MICIKLFLANVSFRRLTDNINKIDPNKTTINDTEMYKVTSNSSNETKTNVWPGKTHNPSTEMATKLICTKHLDI